MSVGRYTDAGETTFNPHLDLNHKHLDVRGCWGSDMGHMHRAMPIGQRNHMDAALDRVQHARELPLPQVRIRAAPLTAEGLEQDRARLQFGTG